MANPKMNIRMFKTGTGDFFLIRMCKSSGEHYHIMLDCGSYSFNKKKLDKIIDEIADYTKGVIDLLIVTHEHADHISGFKKSPETFAKKLTFKKVWFAWTEDPDDSFANELRNDFSKLRKTIALASDRVSAFLASDNFRISYQGENSYDTILKLKDSFSSSMQWLNEINEVGFSADGKPYPPMSESFKELGIIKEDTEIEYREPGEVVQDLIEGYTFFILGPPKNLKYLNDEGRDTDYYKKREKPSEFSIEWMNALDTDNGSTTDINPFEKKYILNKRDSFTKAYTNEDTWRNIDEEWLMNVGNMAIKFERCLNNTSLAFAVQSQATGEVLLFTGDAEFGNWKSWLDYKWETNKTGEINLTKGHEDAKEKSNAKGNQFDVTNLLSKTIFYKVGHHLSQNGTPREKGIDYFTSANFAAMASLDLDIISKGWKNTMPCKGLTAELINKSKGNLYFSGDYSRILDNLDDCDIKIPPKYLKTLAENHKKFDKKNYVEVDLD